MSPAPSLGGSRTEKGQRSKARAPACLVSPSREGPAETCLVLVFLALLLLLLCYCITHSPPGSIIVAALVQQQLRCEPSRVTAIYGAFVCTCMFVRFRICQECVRGVCAVTNSVHNSTTAAAAAVQRQPCFKLSPLFQQSRRMFGWLAHSRKSNHDNVFTCNATTKFTSWDLMPCKRSLQQYSQRNN